MVADAVEVLKGTAYLILIVVLCLFLYNQISRYLLIQAIEGRIQTIESCPRVIVPPPAFDEKDIRHA